MKKWLPLALTALVFAIITQVHAASPPIPTTANKVEGPVTGYLPDNIDLNISFSRGVVTHLQSTRVDFCAHKDSFFNSREIICTTPDRKQHHSGKRQMTGITMTPAINGEWRWDSDYSLSFTPAQPWPAGADYRVEFQSSIFPSPVTLLDSDFDIRVAPLRASVSAMSFFQDRTHVETRGVSTTIRFNSPVAADALKQHLSFRAEELTDAEKPTDRKIILVEKNLPFDLKMSDDGLEANVTTALTAMPDKERFLVINISEGLSALAGGELLGPPDLSNEYDLEKREERVRIPSIYDYARLEPVRASIIKNDHFVPEQTLIIEGNVPVTGEALAQKLRIYALPKDKAPAFKEGKPEKDYRWTSAGEVTAEVLSQSSEIKFSMDTNDAALLHGVKVDAPPGRWLLVRVEKGLTFNGGYILGDTHDDTVEAPEYTKEVKILSDGALLSLSGERKISLYSLGADKIRFEVGRVMNEDISHLVSQTGGSFENPYFRNNFDFNQKNISETFTKEIDLLGADRRQPQFNAFNFSPFMKMPSGEKGHLAPKGKGLFFLTVKAVRKDEKGKEETVSTDQRFVLVSDLGFVVKTASDSSQDVFVQSLSKGQSVSRARVDVLGVNGVPVATVRTDAEGHAVIPSLKGMTDEKRPVAIIVSNGDDMAFMPYDRRDRGLDYSKFDTDGMNTLGDGLRAYLFSDRGVYRPGEQAHIGVIVKQGDWSQNLAGIPLKIELTNPRGQVIDHQMIQLQSSGIAEYRFSTRDTSPTGIYNVRLYIARDGEIGDELGNTAVRVEEFIPDTLKISSIFNKPLPKGWMRPEGLRAEVALAHLYGASAADHRVKASINMAPGHFTFKQFPDHRFFDALHSDKSFDQPLGETQTDADGKVDFDLKLAQFGKSTYRLTFSAEGFAQDSGRSVFAVNDVLVSALPYVVGVKAEGNIGYINKKEKRIVNLIAVDPDLSRIAVKGLKADIVRVSHVSSLIKNEQGAYEYRSVAKETPVSSNTLDIPEKGFDYTIDSTEAGSYALTLSNADGLVLHRIHYAIVGEGSLIDHARKDAVITVRLDQDKYAAGDEIKMNIASPYTGTGLITLETDRVLAFKWFKTTKTSTVQTISIPKGFTGKGFVNVQFVRALDSKEVYTSPLAYAVQPFFVDTASIDSRITLTVPEKIKPGDDLPIQYSTQTPGKIIVYAVDEGILQYARYKTPNPLDFFVNRRALQVATTQILDLLMPEYSLLRAATGGDSAAEEGRSVNPFKRKTQAPVAFWSGIVDADKNSRVLHYKVPDYFNGNLRVMAVAVSNTTMGALDTQAFVKGDLILSPNVPVFAAPGDTFTVGLSLANNIVDSGTTAKVRLTVEPSAHLEVVEGQESMIVVPEGGETKASVRVKTNDVLGGAKLLFTASLNGVSATYEATLSIRPPLPSMTALLSGYAEKGGKTIQQARSLYKEFGKGDASVSTLPLSLIPGLAHYLDRFPYGCTEQTVSRAFPAVTLYGQKDLGGETDVVRESVINTMNRLRELQNSKGGFGYWWYGGEADDFVSVYALHYMTLAKEKHLPVPDDTFRQAQNYVREAVGGRPDSLNEARVKAYGIYVLTRGGVLTANYLPHLLQYLDENYQDGWKQDLAAVYIAASYRLMQMKEDGDALMKEFTLGEPSYWKNHAFYENNWMFYNSLNRYAQYMTVVSDHFPDLLPQLDRNILFRIANFIGEGSYNTLSSSYAIMAFSAYGQASTTDIGADLSISQKGQPLPLSGEVIRRAELALDQGDITFDGDGDYGLFYQIATDGYDRETATQPIEDGLEIDRQYLDKAHAPVKEVALGDTVDVVIRMRAHDDKTLGSMAVVDLLPGGFELMPQSISKPTPPRSDEEGGDDMHTASPPETQEIAWLKANQWHPEAVDAREDRVIAFGSVPSDEVAYRYKIKAVNRGIFTTPPPYVESMYERAVKARGVTGEIVVK